MHKQTSRAIAYVQNFLSFLFLDQTAVKNIRGIYLYGSAVRGELGKDSDIDLFIDCPNSKEVERSAKAAALRFSQSQDYEKWKQLGCTYPFSIQGGVLEEWELKTSIAAESILLYAPKTPSLPGERQVLFILTLPKEKKRYLRLTRQLFGRKEKAYREHGLLYEAQGKKLGSNIFLIPQQQQAPLHALLQKEKVQYSFWEVHFF